MDLTLLTGHCPADVLKIKRTEVRNSAIWIVQNKTGARLSVEFTGELAPVNNPMNERPRQLMGACLVLGENGQPLSQFALRSRFDKAPKAVGVDFQFRDIRGKPATDTGNLAQL